MNNNFSTFQLTSTLSSIYTGLNKTLCIFYNSPIRERSVLALYLLYTRSIPALYQLVYWVLPALFRVNSSKFVEYLIRNS